MGRLSKKGVDFFSHDTDASTRGTVRALQRKYGNDGYAAWFKLLENMGRSESLAIDCKSRETIEFLAESFLMTEEKTIEILDFMAYIEAIDYDLWTEAKIIWVQNYVDRLADVFKKRKKETPQKPSIRSGKRMEIDSPKDHINQTPGTALQPSAADDYPFGLTDEDIQKSLNQDAAIEDAARSFGLPCHEGNMIAARELAREYSLEWLIAAIQRSGDGKAQTWGYVRGILQSWADQGHMDKPGDKRRQPEPDLDVMNKWGGTL